MTTIKFDVKMPFDKFRIECEKIADKAIDSIAYDLIQTGKTRTIDDETAAGIYNAVAAMISANMMLICKKVLPRIDLKELAKSNFDIIEKIVNDNICMRETPDKNNH